MVEGVFLFRLECFVSFLWIRYYQNMKSMNLRITTIFVTLLCSLSAAQSADVYMEKDEHGNPVYSDTPKKNSEKIKLDPLPTYVAPPTPAWRYQAPDKPDNAAGGQYVYDKLTIVTPQQDELIRQNDPTIRVAVIVDPPLQASLGHLLEFYLDNALQARTKQAETYFSNVNPGTHAISIRLVDKAGSTLKTVSVTFNKVNDTRVRNLLQQEQANPSDADQSPPRGFTPIAPRVPQAPKAPSYQPSVPVPQPTKSAK